jgi:hypothetical protein
MSVVKTTSKLKKLARKAGPADKVKNIIRQTLDKYHIDIFEDKENFPVRSVRAVYVIALITGRISLAKLLVNYDTDILGDFLGRHY